MYTLMALPTYRIAGLLVRPGDILGRKNPGSAIWHHALLGFCNTIAHSPGPGDVFRFGVLQEILTPGARLRVVSPTTSTAETRRRIVRAGRLLGVSWWHMNCWQTATFIAGFPPWRG